MIDLELIKKHFDKEWVDSISKSYYDYLNILKKEGLKFNEEYFDSPGTWNNRQNSCVEASEYFNKILHSPNICILDFILKNFEKFRNFKYIDNGSGIGILSVFLKKLGLECFNYDDFSQISNFNFRDYILEKHNIEISHPEKYLPKESDVLCCSSIWVDNPEYKNIDFKYLLIDAKWAENRSRSVIPEMTDYKLIGSYGNIINIYKKHG